MLAELRTRHVAAASDILDGRPISYFIVVNCRFISYSVPEGYKINPGAVEIIVEQPNHADNLLIGYSRGLMVLWKKTNSEALRVCSFFVRNTRTHESCRRSFVLRLCELIFQTYVNNQQLENLCWNDEGTKFVSSHNDGSYIFWSVDSSEPQEEPITVYGPFPCKSITKILWPKSSNSEGLEYCCYNRLFCGRLKK